MNKTILSMMFATFCCSYEMQDISPLTQNNAGSTNPQTVQTQEQQQFSTETPQLSQSSTSSNPDEHSEPRGFFGFFKNIITTLKSPFVRFINFIKNFISKDKNTKVEAENKKDKNLEEEKKKEKEK